MAAPNIVNVSQITGQTAVLSVTTSEQTLVENSASSGQVYKINSIYISNIDGSSNVDFSLDLYRNSTAYYITKTLVVPYDSTVDMLSKPIYLEEGDALRAVASADDDCQVVCSYEVLS